MERFDELRAVVERARDLDRVDDRNAEAPQPRDPVERLEAFEGVELDHIGSRRRIPTERDQRAEIGRGSAHARLVGESDAVDRNAFDRFDREHLAGRVVVPVELGVRVGRVLRPRGAGQDARLDVAFLETRLVAEEAQRAAAEGRVEDRMCEAELQHRGPSERCQGPAEGSRKASRRARSRRVRSGGTSDRRRRD